MMEDYEVCASCLPLKPMEPGSTECCGQGCDPCILDIHQQELRLWKKQCWESHGGGRIEIHGDSSKMNCDEYTSCLLSSVEQVATNSFCYLFTLPKDRYLDISIGMHLILRQVSSSGGMITRQYTPISPPGVRKNFTVLIKLYENGQMSQIIRSWQAGRTMASWRGPVGSFSYLTNQYSHIYLLAAGTGITPMYQIVRHIVENEEEETFLKLLYASRFQGDILLRRELNELASYWNFSVFHFLSHESNRTTPYGEMVHFERISQDMLSQEVTAVASCLAVVCGTREFEGEMKTHLLRLGVPKERIVRF